jgi:hypothetical protein
LTAGRSLLESVTRDNFATEIDFYWDMRRNWRTDIRRCALLRIYDFNEVTAIESYR